MSFRFLPSHPTPRRFDEHRASREAVDKVVALICAALARRGVPDRDRDDLLQDILVAALEAWPRYDADIATPEKWLNGIILHHIQRWQARCARNPLAKTDEQEPRDQEQNPEDGAMMRELAHQLYQEIPFVYRDAFIAHELEGLSLEEIAVSRGIPVSTAHYYVQEGKRQLDAALARWKAKHRDRGVLLLPLTVKALLDADRTIPSPPDAVMAFAWRLVQRKLGRTALDTGTSDHGHGSGHADVDSPAPEHLRAGGEESPHPLAPVDAAQPPMHLPPEAAARPPFGPVAAALVVGLIAGAWFDSVFRTRHDPIAREEASIVSAAPPVASMAISPVPSTVASAAPLTLPPSAGPPAGSARADSADLVAEEMAFDMARTAFAQGNMAAAIQALEQHAQRYPRGRNAPERDRMWIDTLVSLGRTPEACRRAESFRRAYPRSEHLQRLDDLCPVKR